jgi:MFS transporter, DHA2 family, multidrug resistance protein
MNVVSEANATRHVSPWIVAMSVLLAMFMEVLDTTIVNVSLPHIAGNLSSGIDESTWVLTSYLVSNAIVLPLTGWLSTLFGRKRFYMSCVALFTLSSCFCGLAPSLSLLIFFRVVQGAGGGALQPISQAVLVESFPREKTGMAMAIFGMGVVLAPIIGPTLGGWITDNYSWRWIFLINIPVGIVSLLLTSAYVYDPPYLVRKSLNQGARIDYIGLGLIATGLGFLQITLDKGQQEDWFGSDFIIMTACIAVIGLLGAVAWELWAKDPMVDLRLLKDRNFGLATFLIFMVGFILYGSTMLLPIFLQTLLGYTAMLSGLVLSPGGILVLILMPIVGRLLQRFEARWLVVFGVAIVSFALIRMSGFNLEIDFRTAMTARIWQSLGLAFLFVPISTAAFYFIPKRKINNATGIMNLARNVGGSLGIAQVTTMLARRGQFHQNILVAHNTPLDIRYQAAAAAATQRLIQQGSDPVLAARQSQGLLYGMLQRQAAMLAFVDAFRIMGILFAAMIPLLFLMKRAAPGEAPTDVH